jgi:hypothetical protein
MLVVGFFRVFLRGFLDFFLGLGFEFFGGLFSITWFFSIVRPFQTWEISIIILLSSDEEVFQRTNKQHHILFTIIGANLHRSKLSTQMNSTQVLGKM